MNARSVCSDSRTHDAAENTKGANRALRVLARHHPSCSRMHRPRGVRLIASAQCSIGFGSLLGEVCRTPPNLPPAERPRPKCNNDGKGHLVWAMEHSASKDMMRHLTTNSRSQIRRMKTESRIVWAAALPSAYLLQGSRLRFVKQTKLAEIGQDVRGLADFSRSRQNARETVQNLTTKSILAAGLTNTPIDALPGQWS